MKKKIILIGSAAAIAITVTGLILFLVLFNTANEEEIEPKDKYVAIKTGLNLRSNPDKSSSVMALIPFGAMVTVEKSEGGEIFLDGRYGRWVNVKYGDKTGWLFSGFLCDFAPDAVIKAVADHYRPGYMAYYAQHEQITHVKDIEVSIKNIIDNYIVLNVPLYPLGEPSDGDVIWRYDAKQEKFFETFNDGSGYTIYLLYLDNDKYLDMITESICCGSANLQVFLGSKNEFTKIYTGGGNDEYYYLTLGSCGNMEFAGSGHTEDTYRTMYFYRFNCNKREIEQYAKSKVVDLSGIVTSVDWQNLSIVIKGKEDSENASYKFSGHYQPYGKASYYAEYVESLKKNLQKGKNVSFSYTTVEGKKIILRIYLEGQQ